MQWVLPKHQTERWKVNKLINRQWEELKSLKVKTHQSLWIRLDSVLTSAELCMMSSTHPISDRRIHPDDNINHSNNYIHLDYCNEIATIKTALLTPSEVTFHDCEVPKRKRLMTISSETTEVDSHASTSTINARTKKIPDGGYGWIVSALLTIYLLHIVWRQQQRLQAEMKSIFFYIPFSRSFLHHWWCRWLLTEYRFHLDWFTLSCLKTSMKARRRRRLSVRCLCRCHCK